MRAAVLACLVAVAVASCECLGATDPPASDAASKVIQVGVLCPTENEEARLSYNDALQLQQQGSFREAETAFLKAIERDPRYCDAMDDLGVMLRREGATEQAISWYKRSLSVKPDNAVAHQDLAVAYKTLGDTGKAVAEFQWLISHDPGNPEGYYGLGDARLASGEAEAAIGPLLRAEELYRANSSPLLADARYELGVAFYLGKEYRKARDYLALVYPGRDKDPNVNYLLGLCYLDQSIENRGKAREHLLKARELGMDIPADVIRKLDDQSGGAGRPR